MIPVIAALDRDPCLCCIANNYAGYKIGSVRALRDGLANVVSHVRNRHPQAEIIYDHQKAGSDIPLVMNEQVEFAKQCGCDALIIFPFAGMVESSGLRLIYGYQLTSGPLTLLDHTDNPREVIVPMNAAERVRTMFPNAHRYYYVGIGAQGGKLSDVPDDGRSYAIIGRSLDDKDCP